MAKTTAEKILDNALAPKRAANAEGSMEQHPIADQILAKELAEEEIATSTAPGRGLPRLVKLIPPGSD